jgi:hypothetical protein
MVHALQRTADRTDIEAGQTLQVRNRFVGLTEGQELEVVDVSEATLVDGEYPARIDLQLSGYEMSPFAAHEQFFDGLDVKRAVERGALELQ